ncbi:exosome nuclease subunit [Lobosporangium transversale]|uniref:Ribonuclease H-like domain-containing protein n=1 Tax=Lobosporangium transversale TaxID=64571 RepID=A0A1Y2GWC0_9FUNG|nr:ribonuclease H-like domain-containing protein [Lobosporangium transversale]KAF9918488.1 exosome nuclease subunit [Lobosporangium transversale]ORZ24845.1 ribonuclease H-like domain-containing protein [Lobosporangium transversale]|eukprot:XP_021883826.1 ribonuclease H-like domain-containing protein [Lobosporangium transversale]
MAANTIVADFETWQTSLFAALVKATKASKAMSPDDVAFYRTLNPSFATNMEDVSSATLDLCNGLLIQAGGQSAEVLNDADDFTDRFNIITDVVDNMLEKVDVTIDEMKDPRKKSGPVIPQSAPVVALAKSDKLQYKLIHAQNIARPQLRFPDPVDNSNAPFIRKITYKPNAKVDLNYGMDRLLTSSSSTPSELIQQPHPYEYEIKHLEYPQHMFEQRPEQLYLPFDTTTAIWIDTEEALKDMCKDLEMQREIAVDLEHHNYRSFQGFVCLMQISTRDQDYIIDTLELRGSLHLLNQSFTDPNIVKVLHGAESDIIWLQRDFGVYIVNLFDTYHATKLLEFESHSLAHLLKLYANFDADKRYQLADWRIRPLPKEMFNYARSDTHFLLYIYDRMRNALLDKSNPTTHNLLHATLQRSAETALRVHEKEVYDAEGGDGPNGWRNMYSKWNRALNTMQFAVFKALHAWRDQTARDEDESIRYVLPNHMLFTLAEQMPEDAAGVLGCCNPVPPPVKMNASDIALLINRTKASVQPVLGTFKKVEIEVPTHIRFDPKTGLQGVQEHIDNPSEKDAVKSTLTPLEKAAQQNQSGSVIAATSSSMFGNGSIHASSSSPSLASTMVSKPLIHPTSFMASRSNLFGQVSTLSNSSRMEEEGKELAKRIMLEFSNRPAGTAPMFKELTIGVVQHADNVPIEANEEKTKDEAKDEMQNKETNEILFTPKEERETKQKRTDVLVLSSMSKKRARAIDEERAELVKEQSESAAISSNGAADNAEKEEVVVSVKKKKARKEKKSSSTSATPSSSAPASGDELPESFKPFDYNSVRSVVDENIESMTTGKRKKNKKKATQDSSNSEPATPFDPYAKLIESADLKKKDASFSRNPKSGARSMTFSKN